MGWARLPQGLGIFNTGPSVSSSRVWSAPLRCGSAGLLVYWYRCGTWAYAAVFFKEALSGALTNTTVYQSAPGNRAEGMAM